MEHAVSIARLCNDQLLLDIGPVIPHLSPYSLIICCIFPSFLRIFPNSQKTSQHPAPGQTVGAQKMPRLGPKSSAPAPKFARRRFPGGLGGLIDSMPPSHRKSCSLGARSVGTPTIPGRGKGEGRGPDRGPESARPGPNSPYDRSQVRWGRSRPQPRGFMARAPIGLAGFLPLQPNLGPPRVPRPGHRGIQVALPGVG